MSDCENCQKVQTFLGKLTSEKLELFATERNPIAEIINETMLAGFCVSEWCDYFRHGNDTWKDDGLTIKQLRQDLEEVSAMLRKMIDTGETRFS